MPVNLNICVTGEEKAHELTGTKTQGCSQTVQVL